MNAIVWRCVVCMETALGTRARNEKLKKCSHKMPKLQQTAETIHMNSRQIILFSVTNALDGAATLLCKTVGIWFLLASLQQASMHWQEVNWMRGKMSEQLMPHTHKSNILASSCVQQQSLNRKYNFPWHSQAPAVGAGEKRKQSE